MAEFEYFEDHNIDILEDRVEIASKLFPAMGLGTLEVKCIGDFSGEVVLSRSHVDEGWKHKWGEYDKPVNFIGAGFISALFCAVLEMSEGSFKVTEIESIVMGADKSLFNVVKK